LGNDAAGIVIGIVCKPAALAGELGLIREDRFALLAWNMLANMRIRSMFSFEQISYPVLGRDLIEERMRAPSWPTGQDGVSERPIFL
jgi:hypothetical protein